MPDQLSLTVDGLTIPQLGFGTWQLEPADARRMVAEALRIGYRHIDTAWIYKNEAAVGDGIRDAIEAGHVAREDIWLTTKIWVAHFEHDALLRQAQESADSLGFTPDLLLLHWPKASADLRRDARRAERGQGSGPDPLDRPVQLPLGQFREAQALSPAKLVTNQVEYHPYLSLKTAARHGRRPRLVDHRLVAPGPGQDRRRSGHQRDRTRPRQDRRPGHPALAGPAGRHRHPAHSEG